MTYKVLLSDFSKVLLFAKEATYMGSLNAMFQRAFDRGSADFWNLYTFNHQLLDFYEQIKTKYHLTCAIWTSGTVHRQPEVKTLLDPIFDYDFSAGDFHIPKNESQVYQLLAKKLKVKPQQMIYIDDQLINLETAQQVGVKAIQYLDNKQVMKEIKQLFC